VDLAQESVRGHRGRELRPDDLERHVTPVPQVAREIHHGHAAMAKRLPNLVVVGEGGLKGQPIGHREVLRGLRPS